MELWPKLVLTFFSSLCYVLKNTFWVHFYFEEQFFKKSRNVSKKSFSRLFFIVEIDLKMIFKTQKTVFGYIYNLKSTFWWQFSPKELFGSLPKNVKTVLGKKSYTNMKTDIVETSLKTKYSYGAFTFIILRYSPCYITFPFPHIEV